MKRWVMLSVLGGLTVSFGVSWYIQSNRLPCGRFDSISGCVSSVKLQVDELQFDDGTVKINYQSFDLSSGAEVVLVGLQGNRKEQDSEGNTYNRLYAIVALFNARNGKLIRILRELKSAPNHERIQENRTVWTEEIALSPDGSLAASYGIGKNENSLIVQRTADGSKVKTIFERSDFRRRGCLSRLDFSQDNQVLQCNSTLYRLDSDRYKRLVDKDEQYIYPFIADYAPLLFSATAADGTRVGDRAELVLPNTDPKPLNSPLRMPDDALQHFMFSPDSQLFIEGYRGSKVKGLQHLVPLPFRRLSAIAIWTRNGELKRIFFTNQSYRNLAWSRDNKYFALVYKDLSLQVFKAP